VHAHCSRLTNIRSTELDVTHTYQAPELSDICQPVAHFLLIAVENLPAEGSSQVLTIEHNGKTRDTYSPFTVEAAARSKTERTEPGRHWVWQPYFHNLETAEIMFKTYTLSRHVEHIHHHELAHQVRNSQV